MHRRRPASQRDDARAGSPEDSQRRILDAIRRIVGALRLFDRAAEKQCGLSAAQMFVLQKLPARRTISINELATQTYTHQSSVSVVAAKLVEKKLIERATSQADARRVELRITAAGKRLLGKSPVSAQDRLIAAMQSLPASKRRALANLLEELVAGMGMAASPAELFFEDPAMALAGKSSRGKVSGGKKPGSNAGGKTSRRKTSRGKKSHRAKNAARAAGSEDAYFRDKE